MNYYCHYTSALLKNVFNFFVIFLLFSCSNFENEKFQSRVYKHEEKPWTYIIYMAADNNLERFAIQNLYELKQNLSDKNINFIVLFDRAVGYDKTNGNWTGTKIFELSNSSNLEDDCILDLGELDMTDFYNLEKFLDFCQKYYPSENIVLNIWSHSFGVYPDSSIPSINRSLVFDYETGYSINNGMKVYEFSYVLRNFMKKYSRKINILQFDCCFMQMFEIINEIKDCTEYVIGSQCELPAEGSCYETICSTLSNTENIKESLSKLVTNFKNKYKNLLTDNSYCVVDVEKFTSLYNKFLLVIEEILKKDNSIFEEIKKTRTNLFSYSKTFIEYVDFYTFFESLECLFFETDKNISIMINELLELYADCILNKFISNSYINQLHGIGINIPYNEELFNFYTNNSDNILSIYKTSQFANFINRIVK